MLDLYNFIFKFQLLYINIYHDNYYIPVCIEKINNNNKIYVKIKVYAKKTIYFISN